MGVEIQDIVLIASAAERLVPQMSPELNVEMTVNTQTPDDDVQTTFVEATVTVVGVEDESVPQATGRARLVVATSGASDADHDAIVVRAWPYLRAELATQFTRVGVFSVRFPVDFPVVVPAQG